MARTIEEIGKRFAANEEICHRVIGTLALMSNKTRFRILCMLAEGDFCVKEIVSTVQTGKLSNISQQLRILYLAGILEKRRSEQRVIYHLKDRKLVSLIPYLEEMYA